MSEWFMNYNNMLWSFEQQIQKKKLTIMLNFCLLNFPTLNKIFSCGCSCHWSSSLLSSSPVSSPTASTKSGGSSPEEQTRPTSSTSTRATSYHARYSSFRGYTEHQSSSSCASSSDSFAISRFSDSKTSLRSSRKNPTWGQSWSSTSPSEEI